jgi:hypothetical protein
VRHLESQLWVQWVPFQHGEQGNPLHCNPCCCPLRLDLGAAVACCSNGTLDGTKSGDGRVRRNRSCRARGAIDGRAGPMSWDSVPGTPDRRLWLWKTRTCEPTRDGDDRRWLAGRNDRKAPPGAARDAAQRRGTQGVAGGPCRRGLGGQSARGRRRCHGVTCAARGAAVHGGPGSALGFAGCRCPLPHFVVGEWRSEMLGVPCRFSQESLANCQAISSEGEHDMWTHFSC